MSTINGFFILSSLIMQHSNFFKFWYFLQFFFFTLFRIF